jgi:hypothetical protein
VLFFWFPVVKLESCKYAEEPHKMYVMFVKKLARTLWIIHSSDGKDRKRESGYIRLDCTYSFTHYRYILICSFVHLKRPKKGNPDRNASIVLDRTIAISTSTSVGTLPRTFCPRTVSFRLMFQAEHESILPASTTREEKVITVVFRN